MKIAMIASECVPFIKVGGLADVVGTLPGFLKEQGHDVRIIIPKYQKIDGRKFGLRLLPYRLLVPVGDRFEQATVKEGRTESGVPVYFIENARYFFRPEVYRTATGEYADNRERFIFFCRAAMEALKALMFQPDILHCHDWQTGIIPAYLRTRYRTDGFYHRTASVYTIHNIAYQGIFPADTVALADLPAKDFTWDKLEYYGNFNFMKTALVYADMLSTVSPTYAREIQGPVEGRGMEGILQSRSEDIRGILNGIDYDEWNPAKDPLVASPFSREDLSGKAVCKRDLQRVFALPERESAFVIGAVSRLDPQKGYDMVAKALPGVVHGDIQVVILGSGDREIQDLLERLTRLYPGKVGLQLGFNNLLAHKIYAGSDAFLMPSRFEPCGLGQMIAMAYGTPPIVRKTGGLADTVQDFIPVSAQGNGFVFEGMRAMDLQLTIERAASAYRAGSPWKKAVGNAMSADFSWTRAVDQYLRLYDRAARKIRQ